MLLIIYVVVGLVTSLFLYALIVNPKAVKTRKPNARTGFSELPTRQPVMSIQDAFKPRRIKIIKGSYLDKRPHRFLKGHSNL